MLGELERFVTVPDEAGMNGDAGPAPERRLK
jgi:hypothetical protein